jgi:hypothetical protein
MFIVPSSRGDMLLARSTSGGSPWIGERLLLSSFTLACCYF